jgi:3-oxoacyl-[acyl-carrier protein] reductase
VNLIKNAVDAMGGLNVVINNAGIGLIKPLVETTVEDFTKVWETNVKGAFVVGREAAKYFVQQNEGNIVNVASTAAKNGFANGTAYCASKFALSAMTECWRAELRKHNIRVMQVNPSEVITPFATKLGFTSSNVEKKLKPTEIAHTIVAMLELDNVGFITEATVWATNP